MRFMHLSTLVTLVLAWTTTTLAYSKKNDAVKLSQVRTLTLRSDAKTSHRRVSAIPQLKCVGGNAKGKYEVDVMRCTNSGSEYDAEDIQWTCKASLPPEFKLGSTDVICEGYDSPNDPFILKGSCGVEYRLMLTAEGEAKYGSQRAWRSKQDTSSGSDDNDGIATVLFWLFFLFVVGVIIYSVWTGGNNNRGNAGRRAGRGGWGGGGGGGGGDGGNDDPPPPYTPRAQPRPKTTSTPRSSSSSNSQQWRPGFWSGTAAGAAAGYAAGQYANRNNRTRYDDPQPGASSWFGGGRRQPTWGAEPEPSGWFGSNRASSSGGGSSWGGGSSTPSSSRHESTGFGGTRRR